MIEKPFGDDTMSAAQMKVWHKRFKGGQESVESDPRSGRPATNRAPENVECVRVAINKDWRPRLLGPPTAQIWLPATSGFSQN